MTTLARVLLGYRYFLFILFIICNAIICSVAVWNYSLAGTSGHNLQLDAYLIFLGAFGVLFIIPIAAIDILRNNAVVNRVWFECLWVGIFWVMELAGASALTASLSNMVCAPVTSLFKDACTSSAVMVAFTWICSILLLIYLFGLTLSAVLHQGDATNVWHSGVRTFPWYATHGNLASAPSSPVRQFDPRPLALAVPHPQRPARQATLERDLEYGLQRGVAPAPRAQPSYEAPRPAPHVPQMQQVSQASDLYPAVLKSSLPTQTRQVPDSAVPSASCFVPRSQPATSAVASADAARPRPTHPRKGSNGSGSKQRPIPPPLDLTRISAFKTIDDRVSRR